MAADRPAEEPLQIYKCKRCGTIVQIMKPGRPSLEHCGQPMELLVEKTEEIGPALDAAFASGRVACINVMTDPTAVSPGSVALANVGAYK